MHSPEFHHTIDSSLARLFDELFFLFLVPKGQPDGLDVPVELPNGFLKIIRPLGELQRRASEMDQTSAD